MNIKKVFLSSMLIVVLAFYSVSFASDTSNVVIKLTIGNPEMTVNGQTAEIDPGRNTSPVILENRTLVPVRSIIEAMGGTVEWEAEHSKVKLKLKEDEISLTINSLSAFFNGVESYLDVAPVIINERTMLPIRYIAESFKFDVEWDGQTNTVTIIKKIETEIVKNNENKENINSNFEEDIYTENEGFEEEFYEEVFYEEFLEDE